MKKLILLSMLASSTAFAGNYGYVTDRYGNQREVEVRQQRDANYYNQQNLQQLQLQNELNRQRQYNQQRNYKQPSNVIEDTTTGGYYQRKKARRANGY